ncbi:MAG: carbohydrate kinase [Oscillospiraceae bacterium]|jgi:fructokinase|nr:carbohydrate kinase [Oscillospiraceae bacterium]
MDITTLGELLIDFTEAGLSPSGMLMFERNPGGAVANVAAAGARFGLKTAFIGKVGGDMHGQFLKSTLARYGVDTRNLLTDGESFTTLAFVAIGEGGEREFSFYRRHSADLRLRADELDAQLLSGTKILHTGTLSLTAEPARSATLGAVLLAKRAGAVISCDVNYRASLWGSEAEFTARSRELLRETDLLKVSAEEAEALTGFSDYECAAASLLDEYGLYAAAVTLGERGAYILTRRGGVFAPAYYADAVDTSGAGDTFWSGFLYSFLRSGLSPGELDADLAAPFLKFANAAASVCVERRGAMPALPALDEVVTRLRHRPPNRRL